METLEFFKGLEDPLKKKETIDILVKCYEESSKDDYEFFSYSMYSKIVETLLDDKIKHKYNIKDRLDLELHCFNEWKNDILKFDIKCIKQEYKIGFAKLQMKLRNFFPKTEEDIRTFFYGTSAQNGIDDEELKKTLDATNYDRVNENTTWKFIISKYIYINNTGMYDIHHRFYINTDSTYTHYFAKLLMEKCEERNSKYYFKLDDRGDRADTIVLYCGDTNLLKFLNMLKEIKQEHPELNGHLHKPPFLTANIDGWIGYGSEPSIHEEGKEMFSYNSLRTKVIDEAMTKINKEFIKQHKNDIITINGNKMEFVDYIGELVFEEQYNWFRSNAERSRFYENAEQFAERYGFTPNSINNPRFIQNYKNYVKRQIRIIIDKIDNYSESDIIDFTGYNNKSLKLRKTKVEIALRKLLHITRYNISDFDDKLRKEIYEVGKKYNLYEKNIAFDQKYVHSTITKEQEALKPGEKTYEGTISTNTLDEQNAIIIEKDPRTRQVKKYVYDASTGKKTLVHILLDNYNQYEQGTYVNFVEYTTNFFTNLYEKCGMPKSLTFITKDNEELAPLEAMERALTFCSKGGGMSVGDEYSKLDATTDISYKVMEDLYDGSVKKYSDGKVSLEKGIYVNKELIKEYFSSLKAKVIVQKNQTTQANKELKK